MDKSTRLFGNGFEPGDLLRFVGVDPILYPGSPVGFLTYGNELKADQLYRVVTPPKAVPHSAQVESYYQKLQERDEFVVLLAECSLNEYYEVSTKNPLKILHRVYPVGWFEKVNITDLVPIEERKEFIKEVWCLMHSDDRLFRRLKSLTIKSKKNV